MQRDRPVAGDDPGAVVDARRAQRLLGNPQPATDPDDCRLVLARPLLADATVADVDDPVGDLGRRRVVADEKRRRSVLRDELGEEREHLARRLLVEVAGRLVRDEELRPVRERGAERDPLLLAARELARQRIGAIEEADPLEQLARARRAASAGTSRRGRAGARRAPPR